MNAICILSYLFCLFAHDCVGVYIFGSAQANFCVCGLPELVLCRDYKDTSGSCFTKAMQLDDHHKMVQRVCARLGLSHLTVITVLSCFWEMRPKITWPPLFFLLISLFLSLPRTPLSSHSLFKYMLACRPPSLWCAQTHHHMWLTGFAVLASKRIETRLINQANLILTL